MRWWALLLLGVACGGGDDPPLRARTSPDGIAWVGVAVDDELLAGDPRYRETIAAELSSVTPENAMKWDAVEAVRGAPSYARADAVVAFAREHGLRVRGHTLVWHDQRPAWVDDSLDAGDLRAALETHIARTVGRYRGQVAVWDVVNEAIADGGGELRDSV